nr:MAG TPA: hypothetical protein [Caudoviricetes sp.]
MKWTKYPICHCQKLYFLSIRYDFVMVFRKKSY